MSVPIPQSDEERVGDMVEAIEHEITKNKSDKKKAEEANLRKDATPTGSKETEGIIREEQIREMASDGGGKETGGITEEEFRIFKDATNKKLKEISDAYDLVLKAKAQGKANIREQDDEESESWRIMREKFKGTGLFPE